MAIFHYTVKIVGRSKGKSIISASAYLNGDVMKNEETGRISYYTSKREVVYTSLMMCENAPQEWQNVPAENIRRFQKSVRYKRADNKEAALEKFKLTFQKQRLWNEVLKTEKSADAQLGRSFEFSLPKEWSRQEQIDYTTEYIQKTFVDKGMCADWSIHDKGDGNPHVHLLVTMRPFNPKAQAVCARTYIMKSQGKKYKKYNAKGDDSVSYQVYNKNVPGENSIKAANETKGTVMKYKGKLINAYYFSTSWGYTTDYRIWGIKKQKYLKETNLTTITENISNEKIFDKYIKEKPKSVEKKSPFYRWTTYLTTKQIENSIYKNMAVNVGTINRIEINKRGAGGIVAQMTIYGDKRQISIVNQNQIRKILSSYYSTIKLSDKTKRTKLSMLPSAFISIKSVYKNNKLDGIKIYGGGFGHGSGMSQSAACQMAKKGKGYKEILATFYNDVEITSLQ